jgi:hypothetical protein
MRMKLKFAAALLASTLMSGQAEAVIYTFTGTTSENVIALYEVVGRGGVSVGVMGSGALPSFSLGDPRTLADYNVAATVTDGLSNGQAFVFRTNAPGVTVPTRPGGGISLSQDTSLVTLNILAEARNVASFTYSVRIVFPDSMTVTPLSVTAVPGPIAGAGIPALAVLCGLSWWRRRRAQASA